MRNWKISLKLFVWKFSEKLIISSSLHRNNRAFMLITKLVEEMKYSQGLSFSSDVESIIRRRIRPKIKIHSRQMKLSLKRSKWKRAQYLFSLSSVYRVPLIFNSGPRKIKNKPFFVCIIDNFLGWFLYMNYFRSLPCSVGPIRSYSLLGPSAT
jgi:hypothetical protein